MNKQMILVAIAAGSITAIAQNGIEILLSKTQEAPLSTYELLAMDQGPGQRGPTPPPPVTEIPVSPLSEIGPGEAPVGPAAPDGVLPADLAPTPGVKDAPGSARPQIQIQKGWSFLDLIPGLKKPQSASLVLIKTKDTIKTTKDPIWQLQLVSQDGRVIDSMPALTGRASRQLLDRHQSGNKSPLPIGVYKVERTSIERGPFGDPELGKGYWIPITPLFATGRSYLGFHQDPSWGRPNGESGTSGCIGLENAAATVKLVDWIKHFNITQLKVNS